MVSNTVVATAHAVVPLGYPGGATLPVASMAVCGPLKYGSPMPLAAQVAVGEASSHGRAKPELSTPSTVPSRGRMTLPNFGRMPCCPALGAVVVS